MNALLARRIRIKARYPIQIAWYLISLCLTPVAVPATIAFSMDKASDEGQAILGGIHADTIIAFSEKTDMKEEPMNGKEKVTGDQGKDELTGDQGRYLLREARKTIEKRLFGRKESESEDTDSPAIFQERRGTFVTLTANDNLRGCIGHIIPHESLIDGIRVNALNAAFRDPRFPPVSPGEWDRIKIEISILTDPKPLSYDTADDLLTKLRPDVDGVIIAKGFRQATFLPQVWEQLPTTREFLTHLCLKAGLSGDEWQKGGLDVSTYQVQAFEE